MRYLLLIFPLLTGISKHTLVDIPIDYPMRLYSLEGRQVEFITCNKTMVEPMKKVLACLNANKASIGTITYHGCFNFRTIANTDRLSRHAYGEAIDLNHGIPIPPMLVKCFIDNGYQWGGFWKGKQLDLMHFELKKGKRNGSK